jgi:hypothetical protein
MEDRLPDLRYRYFASTDNLVWYIDQLFALDIDSDDTYRRVGPRLWGNERRLEWQ